MVTIFTSYAAQVVFFNTKDKAETANDNKAYATIKRDGKHRLNEKSDLHNAYIYRQEIK